MSWKENKKEYNKRYVSENIKRIPLNVQKTKYEEIKAVADSVNESVNGFIKKSIDMRIEQEHQKRADNR